jgi:P27 family predicted phage terminase small subunit
LRFAQRDNVTPPGRKPKPIAEHRRTGTFRADRHRKSPPAADLAKPKPPAGLFREARTAWTELVRELQATHLLDSSDRHLIELTAVCLGRLRQARAAIAKSGLEVRGDRGAIVAPAVRIELSATRELRALLSELGLSPTSRSRLGIEAAEADPFADLPPNPRKLAAVP